MAQAMRAALTGSGDPPTLAMPHAPVLDGLRAVAIGIVFTGHSGTGGAGLGVTVFFFLSGYLITSLLRVEMAQRGRIDLGAFYLRRTLRIMPPLYLTLLAVFLVWRLGWLSHPVDPWAIPAQLLFLQNYAFLWGHGEGLPVTSLWSLAVEEHFYLVFPLLYLLVLGRMPPPRAALWCLAACAVVLGVRVVNALTLEDYSGNYLWTHTRIDSILYGSCLALWNNPVLDKAPWRPHAWQAVLALGLLGFTFAWRDPFFRETLRYSLQGVALFVLFAFALHDKGPVSAALSSWPARRLGLYSYSLYLVHNALFKLAEQHLHLPAPARMLVVLAAGLAYSAAMYAFIEKPAADLRRRLHERRLAAAPGFSG
jgi:peptidoglycan/LPS O-acetylase OafA/YrhL